MGIAGVFQKVEHGEGKFPFLQIGAESLSELLFSADEVAREVGQLVARLAELLG